MNKLSFKNSFIILKKISFHAAKKAKVIVQKTLISFLAFLFIIQPVAFVFVPQTAYAQAGPPSYTATISSAPQTAVAVGSSSAPITLHVDPVADTGGLDFVLSSTNSDPGSYYFTDSNETTCGDSPLASSTIHINATTSNKHFCYFDSTPGTYTLTTTNMSGLSSPASQDITFVSAGPDYATIFGDIKTTLAGPGPGIDIDTNIDTCASTPTACSGLYFEKTGKGKIAFAGALDLSDSATVTLLRDLGNKMNLSDGYIKFDSATATAMAATGATIYMYGFTSDGGDILSASDLVVKDDSEIVVDPTGLISGFAWSNSTGVISFGASHFTSFYMPDTMPPFITSFTIPETASSLTISISSFTAHDNPRGMPDGYLLTENSTKPSKTDPMWNGVAPTNYTFATAGAKTLYAWVRDAAGNVSSAGVGTSDTTTITLAPSTPTLSSIAITTPATKLSYTVGDLLDITGLVVTGTYSDASTKVETVIGTDVTGFDSSTPVTGQVLTVTIGGKTTTYTVNIVAAIIDITAPTISNLDIDYPAAHPTYATDGDHIIINVDVTDTESGVAVVHLSGFCQNVADVIFTKQSGDSYQGDCEIGSNAGSAGTHTVPLYAKDNSNNEGSISAQFTTVKDETPPTVNSLVKTYPAGQTYAKLGDTVHFTADVSDDSGVASVKGNGLCQTDPLNFTNTPGGNIWEADCTIVDSREWVSVSVPLVVTDNKGNSEQSHLMSCDIDNGIPTASVTSPTTDSMLSGTVTITADASDAESGIAKVEFRHASPTVGVKIGEDTTAPYSFAWDTKDPSVGVSDGSHSIWAVAYDNAGNKIISNQINVTVDNTPPVANAGIDRVVNDHFTSDATATDVGGSGVASTVWTQQSGPVGGAVLNSWSVLNPDISATIDGTYVLRLDVTDIAGNSHFDTMQFIWDTTIPTINLVSPSGGTLQGTVAITADVSDAGSGVQRVEFLRASDSTIISTDTEAPYEASWNTATVADGAHEIWVVAYDNLGNSAASTHYSVTIDNTPPTITGVTTTTADGTYGIGQVVDFEVSFSEAVNVDVSGGTPEFLVNAGPGRKAVYVSGSGGTTLLFNYTVGTGDGTSDLAYINGDINLSGATIKDSAGNDAVVTLSDEDLFKSAHAISIYTDTIVPTVVLSDDHADSVVRDADTVIITATFTENDQIDEVTPPTISIHSVGIVNNAPMTEETNLVWTYTWNVPSGSNGTHTVSILAHDRAGNANTSATGKTSYTIDNIAPTVVSIDSDDQSYNLATTSPHKITITFSEDVVNTPTVDVHTTVGNQSVNNCGDADAKTFCFDYAIITPQETTHTIYISNAQDLVGNTMTLDNSHTFIVDTIAPVITIDPYNTDPTNQNVTVTASTNEGTLNATSHTFTANGSFDFVATDAAGNATTETVSITNINKTAPVLSATSASDVGLTTATLNFATDKAGTYYYLVYLAPNGSTLGGFPNATKVKAQGIAVAKGTAPISVETKNVSVTGLSDSTGYNAYVIVEDVLGNLSAVSKIPFTTLKPADVFVDDNYNSGNAGGHTWNVDAFNTIQAGIDKVATGGTVQVNDGTYNESININKAVSVVSKNGRDVTTINGSGTTVTMSSSNSVLQGFTITGSSSGKGVYSSKNSNLTVKSCDISHFQTGIWIEYSANDLIEDNVIQDNGLIIFNTSGIHFDGVTNSNIKSNTINHNDYGIHISGATTNNIGITNNTISNNLYEGIRVEAGQGIVVAYNKIYGNISPETGLYNGTETFVDAQMNWWGDATGPAHADNASGTGDAVSSYVKYSPWYGNVDFTALRGIPTDNEDTSKEYTVTEEFNATSADYDLTIPADTVATGTSDWNGEINPPTVITVLESTPSATGSTTTMSEMIEVGYSGSKLILSNAAKLVFSGEAGKKIGYTRPGTSFTEIITICGDNTQVWADANLGTEGDCKIDVGSDLVVWTKHFTQFATYTQTASQTAPTGLAGVAPTSSANNNGQITGTDSTMEYKLSTGETYTAVTGASIAGLAAGNYDVRYAAKTGYNASSDTVVTVPAYVAPVSSGGGGGGAGLILLSKKSGDGNGDGHVDELDFSLLMSQWGQTGSNLSADLNHDGVVDELDFSILMANWGL